jgi:hypothetical protein
VLPGRGFTRWLAEAALLTRDLLDPSVTFQNLNQGVIALPGSFPTSPSLPSSSTINVEGQEHPVSTIADVIFKEDT